ncbi:MAG: molybdopterin-dependent oxidoreductase [Chloroflexi bacterium]|nr:molybdopterin-dependent oxidoreductase [Chloroflexota bacterium]
MELTRRDFLKISGSSAAGAVLFAGCTPPEHEWKLESPVLLPEDTLTSFENWYASVCRQCEAGCGIITRVVEGRAKKIEGNPLHPLNRGKLCARGEAGLQALYHPDRLRTPLRRTGPRGMGQYQIISWDEALNELVSRLKDQQAQGSAGAVALVTGPLRGLEAHLVTRFARAYGATSLAYAPLEETALQAALKQLFGQDTYPVFDIARANYILSFGANFLEPWISQVHYNRAYGEFRQGQRTQRGYLVQVEPRLSTTAANADEWVPVTPGTEGVLALSIAYVLIDRRLASPTVAQAMTGGAGVQGLGAFRPEEASRITGVPAERIEAIAKALAERRPALVLGGLGPAGHTNGLFNLTAIYALNFLLESVGRPGGVLLNPAPPTPELAARAPASPFLEWQRFAERLRTKQPRPVNILMVHDANPLYGLPPAVQFGEGLKNVPVIISFSSFMDETTAMADLILPDSTYLESWGESIPDPGPGFQAVGFQQPVVKPYFSTRSFTDVLLTVAGELGGQAKEELPWNTYKDALRETAQRLFRLNRGSIRKPDFESFWNTLLQEGGWRDEQATAPRVDLRLPVLARQSQPPQFSGTDKDYPFYLHVFASAGLSDGRGAHLPWLQMTPDPTTTIMWQSWVEMNPRTAAALGLRENDVVVVESPQGRLETMLYLYPAIPPGVVAMPTGQGHTYLGRYAEKRGANPLSILAPMATAEGGALAWGATRVRISKTGRQYPLPKLEGSVPAVQPEDYTIIPVTDLRTR